MSIETGVLFDRDGQPLFWHEPPGRSSVYLPDSRTLWDVIWHNRARLGGFAHTHPGSGSPTPSQEDYSTFRAVELALGEPGLHWWVISEDSALLVRWLGLRVGEHELWAVEVESPRGIQLPWLYELRRRSYSKEGV